MTEFTVTAPTADEQAALLTEHGQGKASYPPPAEGYVRGTVVAKALNGLLENAGITHKGENGQIRPQMVYNYLKKGYIKTDSYPHIPAAEAKVFVELQFARRVAANAVDEAVEVEENEEA